MCNHALDKSYVYTKPQEAQMTFVKMMGASSYLRQLMPKEMWCNKLVEHLHLKPSEASVASCLQNHSTNSVQF